MLLRIQETLVSSNVLEYETKDNGVLKLQIYVWSIFDV